MCRGSFACYAESIATRTDARLSLARTEDWYRFRCETLQHGSLSDIVFVTAVQLHQRQFLDRPTLRTHHSVYSDRYFVATWLTPAHACRASCPGACAERLRTNGDQLVSPANNCSVVCSSYFDGPFFGKIIASCRDHVLGIGSS